jgi:NitT/TauT family transport system permease protein
MERINIMNKSTKSSNHNEESSGNSKMEFAIFGRDPKGNPKSLWETTLFQWIVSISIFLILWEGVYFTGLVEPRILPPPHLLLEEIKNQPFFWDLKFISRKGNYFNLPTTIYISMRRVILGLTMAFIISVITGLLISYIRIVRRLLLPIIRMFAPISPVAWMPLIMFFLGVGEAAIVVVVFVSLFFSLTLSTILSIENVENIKIDAAKILGASRQQILSTIIIPAIIPDLFRSLRRNFYAAWMSLLVAEMIGAKTGLGQMVMAGRGVFNMQLVLLGMVVIAIFGMASEEVLHQIQNKVLWWQTSVEI